MSGEEFVKNIESEILTETFNRYFSTFATIDRASIGQELWKKAIALYDSTDTEGRENMKGLVKLVMIDVLSNIFGKLDGISSFANQSYPLELKCGEEIISGDLQDFFIMDLEEEGI